MLHYVLFGVSYAFAAAIQPGPLQAFLLTRVATIGWRRTLPACLSPLLSDGPIAVLVLLVLGRLAENVQQLLRIGGGALLLYFAWGAVTQWRRGTAPAAGGSAPRTLLEATVVNLLNPNAYLGWTLVLGPTLIAAWRERPARAFALIIAFYVTLVTTTGGFVLVVGTSALFGARGRRALILISAVVLASLGVCLVASGVGSFTVP
jgi:threonine/homoserine/homoserine lactone efflux protein